MRLISFLLLLSSFFLFSCSKDEGFTVPYDGPISFSTRIGGGKEILTRASGQSWAKDDQVGVFMTKADYSLVYTGTHSANKLHKASAAGTSCTLSPSDNANTLYYPVDGSSVRFIAYYPYLAAATLTTRAVTISTTQSAANMPNYDILWHKGTADFSRSSSALPSMAFKHQMSKVIVKVTWKSPEMDDVTTANKEGLVVKMTGIPTTATFSPTSGGFTSPGGTTSPVQLYTATKSSTFEGIIIPHSTGTRTMTFTYTDNVTGKAETLTHPLTTTFASNTEYTYNVTISRKKVEFTGCTIGGWTKSTGGSWTIGDRDNN